MITVSVRVKLRVRVRVRVRIRDKVKVKQHFTRQSHHAHVFLIQKNSLHYGLKSIRYLGPKMLNDFLGLIRNSASRFSFKRTFKKFILVSL